MEQPWPEGQQLPCNNRLPKIQAFPHLWQHQLEIVVASSWHIHLMLRWCPWSIDPTRTCRSISTGTVGHHVEAQNRVQTPPQARTSCPWVHKLPWTGPVVSHWSKAAAWESVPWSKLFFLWTPNVLFGHGKSIIVETPSETPATNTLQQTSNNVECVVHGMTCFLTCCWGVILKQKLSKPLK